LIDLGGASCLLFYFDNAIAWAQFRIKGGWKNLLTLAVGDAALIALGVTLAYQTARTPSERRDAMEIASLMCWCRRSSSC